MSKKFLKYWLPPTIWAALIFYFSSRSIPAASEIYWRDFLIKKTAHIIEYGIFAILLYRAFRGSGYKKASSFFYSLSVSVIYAISDEFHQSFIPGREPRIRDIVFDTIGGSGGLYLIKNRI